MSLKALASEGRKPRKGVIAELIETMPEEQASLLVSLLNDPGFSGDRIAKALREDGHETVTGNAVNYWRRLNTKVKR